MSTASSTRSQTKRISSPRVFTIRPWRRATTSVHTVSKRSSSERSSVSSIFRLSAVKPTMSANPTTTRFSSGRSPSGRASTESIRPAVTARCRRHT